jgi:hypothetical protein
MRVLMRTLSGWMTYTTLRATQLGVSRRRVLLLVGSLAVLTLAVTVFRSSRSSTAPPGRSHIAMPLAPTPAEVRASTRPREAEPPVIATTSADMPQAESAADLVNPFTGMTLQEEQEARGLAQRARTDQRRLELTTLAVEIARQEQALARVRKETQALLRPPARPVVPRVPAIPQVQPLAIASQSALVLYRGVRITTWPGSTLGAWTVEAVFPDGVAIRYQGRRAFLPLTFPSPSAH